MPGCISHTSADTAGHLIQASPFHGVPLRSAHWTEASISYLKPQRERPFNYMFDPPHGTPWQNCEYEAHTVCIRNARECVEPLRVHGSGFAICNAPTAVADFADEDQIKGLYYKELESLALFATGGSRAYVFDHLVRNREAGRPALGFGRHGDGSQPAAVGRAHNDYTEQSGLRRLSLVLKDESIVRDFSRFCIVNIWRPLNGPVVDTPLALCDARTVAAGDLVASDVHYPARSGEIYLVHHSGRHAWHYFPDMTNDEALVFKQYDSQVSGVARFTPHAAFDLPDVPADAPLRRSIEARVLILFDA